MCSCCQTPSGLLFLNVYQIVWTHSAHFAVPSYLFRFVVAQHHRLLWAACSIPMCAAAAAAATRRLGSCRPLQILDALHQLRLAAADRCTARSEHILQCSLSTSAGRQGEV
jgi:hypothetical protein